MLKTYKINEFVYVSTDASEIALFELNVNGQWDVFIPALDEYIANDLDTFDAAEGTAFQWLSQVSA